MNEFALKFRDPRKNREDHAASRRRCIGPWFMQRPQTGFGLFQLFGDIQQVAR
jgi:hypothetical protein